MTAQLAVPVVWLFAVGVCVLAGVGEAAVGDYGAILRALSALLAITFIMVVGIATATVLDQRFRPRSKR